jgi:DNA-binding transcriptional MerR regulator
VVDARYAIGDLADLGGVSRRTVRYYVQEGLLPAPFGVGRGNHYGPEHLDQLLRVKALQEAGRTLDEIRRALNGATDTGVQLRVAPATEPAPLLERTSWRR